jgi:hypothetical protein
MHDMKGYALVPVLYKIRAWACHLSLVDIDIGRCDDIFIVNG